jgi:hypothetical protein
VYLKDIQLYVFCSRYRQDNMRQKKSGAFQLDFVSDQGKSLARVPASLLSEGYSGESFNFANGLLSSAGAQRFREVFYPPAKSRATSEGNERRPATPGPSRQ